MAQDIFQIVIFQIKLEYITATFSYVFVSLGGWIFLNQG